MTILEKYQQEDSPAGFRPWAYTVLRLKIGNYLKSQKARRERFRGSYSEQVEQEVSGPDWDHDLRRKLIECFRLLAQANRRFARVLNLSHQGYRAQEICKRLRISLSNLYSILSRGRSLIRRCLERGEL
jgi:RNA polymerase sigma factor (sigma-70 family)